MLTSSLKQKWQILFCRTFPTFRHQVSWRRESLVKKMLCYAQDSATIIKTYGSPTYLRTLRQFRRTALPSACCCFDHTCILVGNSLISFFGLSSAGTILSSTQSTYHLLHFLMRLRDLQPLFKLRLPSIYGSLIKQNEAVSHRRTCVLLESATNWEIDKNYGPNDQQSVSAI